MTVHDSRRGSALLMVLGMIAFMIVSALGFSAYMRYSRLPSSYLRRSVASRQLVKAGLARAINDLDLAINSNPHPGVGENSVSGAVSTNLLGNFWKDRVFMGTRELANVDAHEDVSRWAMTVPVLTLEGLAYIPSPLVNNVRVYSRITASAEWHNLDYDAGRYAYVAVDVSDFFDVNRMVCDKPRSSASDRRVSFSYLFELNQGNGQHVDMNADGAAEFDEFLGKFRKPLGGDESSSVAFDFSQKTPLVSVADFNLALWKWGGTRGVGGIRSPFCEWMQGKKDRDNFYGLEGGIATGGTYQDFDNMLEMAQRPTFVTDGYYPESPYYKRNDDRNSSSPDATKVKPIAAGNKFVKFNLGDPRNQPLPPKLYPDGNGYSLFDVVNGNISTSLDDEYTIKLGAMGLFCLADYLDPDSNPISLMVPSWEQCPMLCGIQPYIIEGNGFHLKGPDPTKLTPVVSDATAATAKKRTVEQTVEIFLQPSAPFDQMTFMSVAAVSPYVYPALDPQEHYVDGIVKFFFSEGDATLRSTGKTTPLRIATLDEMGVSQFKLSSGFFCLPFGGQRSESKINAVTKRLKSQEETVNRDLLIEVKDPGKVVENGFANTPVVRLTYQWEQTKEDDESQWRPSSLIAAIDANAASLKISSAACTIKPLTPGMGDPATNEFSDKQVLDMINSDKGLELSLNAAVWTRIFRLNKEGEKEVVDMVPACAEDDYVQNPKWMKGQPRDLIEIYHDAFCGNGYPMLRFDTGVRFKLSKEIVKNLLRSQKQVLDKERDLKFNFTPNAALCADPRFNYAPEHWFSTVVSTENSGPSLGEMWLSQCHASDSGRDGDIFLATSDQGYLQSPYELAFLPRFTDLYTCNVRSGLNVDLTGYYVNPGKSGKHKDIPGSFSEVDNSELMWRSYNPYGADADAFADLGITARGHGSKVNPYSDNINILMAALANTPSSWRFASTNNFTNLTPDDDIVPKLNAQTFNRGYAVNGYGQGDDGNYPYHTYIPWITLTGIASNLSSRVRSFGLNWESAFESMSWDDPQNPDDFCGVSLADSPPLWGVDRKFLYGFWRDCFSADQQLFLIFVRAEPAMMGGEITGQVPPNLGSRAVALVWRKPRGNPPDPDPNDPDRAYDIIGGYPHTTRVLFYHTLD